MLKMKTVIHNLEFGFFEGTGEDIKQRIDDLEAQSLLLGRSSPGAFDVSLEWCYGDSIIETSYMYSRVETQEECDERIEKESALKNSQIERDRKQYEALKAKFEEN